MFIFKLLLCMYSHKVNLYGYILETEYDMEISGYYLAVVHPEFERGRLISCPRLEHEMNLVHEYEMECGRARVSLGGLLAPF